MVADVKVVGSKEGRGVNLSPKAMVDSLAEWPLSAVVAYLRKKEKEEVDDSRAVDVVRLHCRSTIKSLTDVMDVLATDYGVSRNRMARWLSYHAVMIARDDMVVSRLLRVYSDVQKASLLVNDTDTIDVMNGLVQYTPHFIDERMEHLHLYDAWVASEFECMGRVCGVHKYRITQVYMVKSILSDDISHLGKTAERLAGEVKRWDKWMAFRLGALSTLVPNGE